MSTSLLCGIAWAEEAAPAKQVAPPANQEVAPAKQASPAKDGTPTKDTINAATFAPAKPGELIAQVVKAEILLDRADASPGVIDGKVGDNFKKALTAYAQTQGLPATSELNEAVWQALDRDTAPALVDYTIDASDVAGPYIDTVPTDFGEMAKLKALSYTGPAEMLAERFHMDERFLKALNPDADFAKAGTSIVVANVSRVAIKGAIARVDVDKMHGQVRALDAQGNLVVAYPATIGSDDTPSPTGSYKVRAVVKNPDYTYNPHKNFKQGKNTHVLRIAPGPNNPVGSTFIALTKPTYGIHGTPAPEKIDKSGSHGCVRLTNWDARELANAIKKGTPVTFVE